MEGKDNIKELFSEKLGGFEANVRPELWSSISSQIGASSGAAAGGGLSLLSKTIIGISIAASVATVGYFVLTDSKTEQKETKTLNVQTDSVEEINTNQQTTEPEEQKKIENDIKKNTFTVDPIIEEPIEQINLWQDIMNVAQITVEPEITNVDVVVDNSDVAPQEVKATQSNDVVETHENPTSSENINSEVTDQESKVNIILPNVFTPDGDRSNDYLTIESSGLTDFSIVVLDLSNRIVYRSEDVNFQWDGATLTGEPAPEGNYIYYITARDSEGKLISRHNLLRLER